MHPIIIIIFGAVMFWAGMKETELHKKLDEEQSCQERCEKGRCPKDEIIKRKNIDRDNT